MLWWGTRMRYGLLSMGLVLSWQTAAALDYGKAFMARIFNNTAIPATLDIEGQSPSTIPGGSTIGKEVDTGFLGKIANLGSSIAKGILPGDLGSAGDITKGTIEIMSGSPKISGFGIQTIDKFSRDNLLLINPLFGRGAAWLARELSPLEATITFQANVPDGGEVHVCFGEDKTKEATWRIVFGAMNNTKALLYRADVIEMEAPHELFPEAAVKPGVQQDFWVSVDGTRILAGVGAPGRNPIFAWNDIQPIPGVKLVGLSCDDKQAIYSNVQLGPPVRPVMPDKEFWKADVCPINGIPLREPGTGTITFTTPRDGSCALVLRNDDDPATHCLITATQEGLAISLMPATEGLEPYLIPLTANANRLWISLDGGRMMIGEADSKRACGIISDPWFTGASSFAFNGTPSKITLSTPTTLALDIQRGSAVKYEFIGALNIAVPYIYQFVQKGQSIEGKDLVNGQTYLLGKAPQQDALYFFDLDIKPNGLPELKWQTDPTNPKQFAMDAGAFALRIVEAALYMSADSIGTPQGEDSASLTVPDSIARAFLSAGLATAGAAVRTGSAAIEAESKMGFRDESAYVYTEKVSGQKGVAAVSQQAQAQRAAVEQKLKFAAGTRGNTRKDFDFLLSTMLEVITLANEAYVVDDQNIKSQVYSTIDSLVGLRNVISEQVSKERWSKKQITTTTLSIWSGLISLLIAALRNEFLANDKNDFEAAARVKWRNALQTVSRELMVKETWSGFTIPAAYGEYLDTGKEISSKSGSVYFEAKGAGDLLVGLLPKDITIKTGSELYEIGIGTEENSQTELRTRHLKNASFVVTADDEPTATLSTFDFKPFWVSCKDGIITVGQGVWGGGTLFSWQDPYPSERTLTVAFSSWGTPIEIKNVVAGPAVEDLSEEEVKELREGSKSAEAAASAIKEPEPTKTIGAPTKGLEQEKDILTEDALTQDQFQYDPLEMAAMEMKYDELSYEDLSFEAAERTKGEAAVTLQTTEKKLEVGAAKEDATKKVFQKPEKKPVTGYMARQQQMGVTAVAMEIRGISGEVGQVASAIKKAVLTAVRAVTWIAKLGTKGQTKALKSDDQKSAQSAKAAKKGALKAAKEKVLKMAKNTKLAKEIASLRKSSKTTAEEAKAAKAEKASAQSAKSTKLASADVKELKTKAAEQTKTAKVEGETSGKPTTETPRLKEGESPTTKKETEPAQTKKEAETVKEAEAAKKETKEIEQVRSKKAKEAEAIKKPKTEKEIEQEKRQATKQAVLSAEAETLEANRQDLERELKEHPGVMGTAVKYIGKTALLPVYPVVKLLSLCSTRAKKFLDNTSLFKQIKDDVTLIGKSAKQWTQETWHTMKVIGSAKDLGEGIRRLDDAVAAAWTRTSDPFTPEFQTIFKLASDTGRLLGITARGKGSIYVSEFRTPDGKILKPEDIERNFRTDAAKNGTPTDDASFEKYCTDKLDSGDILRGVKVDPVSGEPERAPKLDENGNVVYKTKKDEAGQVIYQTEKILNPATGNIESRLKLDADGNKMPVVETRRVPETDEFGHAVYEKDADGEFARDKNGNKIPVYKTEVDADGNPVYEKTFNEKTGKEELKLDANGKPILKEQEEPVAEHIYEAGSIMKEIEEVQGVAKKESTDKSTGKLLKGAVAKALRWGAGGVVLGVGQAGASSSTSSGVILPGENVQPGNVLPDQGDKKDEDAAASTGS